MTHAPNGALSCAIMHALKIRKLRTRMMDFMWASLSFSTYDLNGNDQSFWMCAANVKPFSSITPKLTDLMNLFCFIFMLIISDKFNGARVAKLR